MTSVALISTVTWVPAREAADLALAIDELDLEDPVADPTEEESRHVVPHDAAKCQVGQHTPRGATSCREDPRHGRAMRRVPGPASVLHEIERALELMRRFNPACVPTP